MLLFVFSLISLAILVRIVSNPLANVFQKKLMNHSADPLFVTATTYGSLTILCLFVVPWPSLLINSREFWTNMLACAVLSAAGNVFLARAVQIGELSVLGPINAYKAVVSMLVGIVLIGEIPSLAGLAGIGLIVAGSYIVLWQPSQASVFSVAVFRRSDVRLRLLALCCSAIDGVFLKKAIVVSTPLIALSYWAMLGFMFVLCWMLFSSHNRWSEQGQLLWKWRTSYLLLFLATGFMQLSTNIALQGVQVGYALALFQTSALLSVLFGYQFFGEGHLVPRLVGASVMVAGASLIVILG